MAKDPILERLGRERDAARDRQQRAFEAMKKTGDVRRTTSEATSRAFEKKKAAQERTSRAFEKKKAAQDAFFAERNNVQSRRDSLSSSIDAYKRSADGHRAQADYYSNLARTTSDKYMHSNLHDNARRERELARHESQQARGFVDQIRAIGSSLTGYKNAMDSARSEFDAAKRASDQAKAEFDRLKSTSDQAKREHETARKEFETAKADYAKVKIDFGTRLAELRSQRQPKSRSVVQSFAERALAEVGIFPQGKRREIQYEDEGVRVVVREDYNRNRKVRVTDILVYDRNNRDEHYHHIVDEHGAVILSEWRANTGR